MQESKVTSESVDSVVHREFYGNMDPRILKPDYFALEQIPSIHRLFRLRLDKNNHHIHNPMEAVAQMSLYPRLNLGSCNNSQFEMFRLPQLIDNMSRHTERGTVLSVR